MRSTKLETLVLALVPLAVFATSSKTTVGQTVVLPRSADKIDDYVYDGLLDSRAYFPIRLQYGYSLAEMSRSSILVRRLAWRPNNRTNNFMPTSSQTLDVYLSHGTRLPSAFTKRYASNSGNDRTRVWSGQVNWPHHRKTPRGPAQFLFGIKLSRPFLVAKRLGRRSLVVDVLLRGRTAAGAQRMLIDAMRRPWGTVRSNGTLPAKCRNSRGLHTRLVGYDVSGLSRWGGNWLVGIGNLPIGAAGFTKLSTVGSGQSWNGVRLPFDLDQIGIPHCAWHVGLDGPTVFWQANGFGTAFWRVPNFPAGLGGLTIYEQGLYFEPRVNRAGLVPTISHAWTVSRATYPDVAALSSIRYANAATGMLLATSAAVISLEQ